MEEKFLQGLIFVCYCKISFCQTKVNIALVVIDITVKIFEAQKFDFCYKFSITLVKAIKYFAFLHLVSLHYLMLSMKIKERMKKQWEQN